LGLFFDLKGNKRRPFVIVFGQKIGFWVKLKEKIDLKRDKSVFEANL